jgi:hypothetical protein
MISCAIGSACLSLRAGAQESKQAFDNILAQQKLALEREKLQLEERRLYFEVLKESQISEEKAKETATWLLANLRGYPKGKGARQYSEADTRLLVETLASVKNRSTGTIR